MKTFTSLTDLDQLAEDNPARPVVRQLLVWLIGDGEPTTIASTSLVISASSLYQGFTIWD